MDLAVITGKQVLMLFVCIAAGFIGAKSNVVKAAARKAFSDLLVYIIVPCMVVHSYMMEFHEEVLKNLAIVLGMGMILIPLGIMVGYLMTIPLKKDANRNMICFMIGFSNCAYMGFPLIQALFGDEGLLYASIYVTAFNIFVWSIGVVLMKGATSKKDVLKSVAGNPVFYAVFVGLLIYFFQIPVPEVLEAPLDMIGDMNTPLSMIITGMIIAYNPVGQIMKNYRVWVVVLGRLLIAPAISLVVVRLFGITGMVSQILVLLCATPTAALSSVFAVQYGRDEQLAAGSVVITTFLSVITLPVVAFLVS
ncbi:MAG: AEC family transporter [Lachnospiraceae bacterium]|nr:AEC family transporter [Lachnospiraceae bacterium]